MPSLKDYSQSLLDCSLVALDEAGAPPCKEFLSPSPTPPWDDCCTCRNGDGQLTVSVVSAQPVTPFRGQPCGRQFRISFRILLTRCTPTVNETGEFPSPAQLNAAADKMFRDREALFKAVTCCWAEMFDLDVTQWSLGPFSVLEPAGGCQGISLDVQLEDTLCSDCG